MKSKRRNAIPMSMGKVLSAVLFLLESTVESLRPSRGVSYASSTCLPCDLITLALADWAKVRCLIQRPKAYVMAWYKGPAHQG